ncbi:MAG: AFG1/ZapE family ATPase, partial [Pseudomonadota bacterium]
MSGPVGAAYKACIAKGLVSLDHAQAEAIELLNTLEISLSSNRGGWLRRLDSVRGLYLWGGVGRGKSMLMDL